jgi:hypothetical protein
MPVFTVHHAKTSLAIRPWLVFSPLETSQGNANPAH